MCACPVGRGRSITKCFCVLKLPDCSLVKAVRVGVCGGGGMCGAGACATVIVLSLNSCCHRYCVPVGRLLECIGT